MNKLNIKIVISTSVYILNESFLRSNKLSCVSMRVII